MNALRRYGCETRDEVTAIRSSHFLSHQIVSIKMWVATVQLVYHSVGSYNNNNNNNTINRGRCPLLTITIHDMHKDVKWSVQCIEETNKSLTRQYNSQMETAAKPVVAWLYCLSVVVVPGEPTTKRSPLRRIVQRRMASCLLLPTPAANSRL